MPRVTAEHEQQVRDRIVRAALRVFAEKGFHRATMQDVVRESGLSVGAIYTWFRGKDDLILAGCDLITAQEIGELGVRLAVLPTFRERLAGAIGYYFDQLDHERVTGHGPRLLLEAWAAADSEPAIREMLQRRRRVLGDVAVAILHDGVARGELPPWLDIPPLAAALSALLDGLLLEAMEEGAGYRRAEAQRRAHSVVEVLLAATGAPAPEPLPAAPAQPYTPAHAEPAGGRS